jgi:multicomponent Na+:H+ antiporter subunit G
MDLLLDIASWLLLIAGGFFCLTAGLGLVRMPDLFTRAHATSILDSMGAGLILVGLALQAPNYLVVVKLLFTFFFLMITGLAAVHALAQTVNVAGINPRLANIVKRLDKNTGAKYPEGEPVSPAKTGESS